MTIKLLEKTVQRPVVGKDGFYIPDYDTVPQGRAIRSALMIIMLKPCILFQTVATLFVLLLLPGPDQMPLSPLKPLNFQE